jgi:capsule polysaccharide export protein KpsE/RkpR
MMLPEGARRKLQEIEQAAADAESLSAATMGRIRDLSARVRSLEDQRDRTMRRDQIAALDAEIAELASEAERLQPVLAQRRAKAQSDRQLAVAVRQWLEGQPPGVRYEMAAPIRNPMAKGETAIQAIGRLRDEIGRLQAELRRVRAAPLSKAAQKQRARAYVDRLASEAGATVRGLDGGRPFELHFAAVQSTSIATSAADIKTLRVLAWAAPDALLGAIDRELDKLPSATGAMDAAEKEAALAELADRIDALERAEEGLIEAVHASGGDVARRPDAGPAAVLGIRRVDDRVAAARSAA